MRKIIWLNIRQTAQYLNVHPETVRRMVRSNKIRATKFDKDWRVDSKFLDDFVSRNANISPRRISK